MAGPSLDEEMQRLYVLAGNEDGQLSTEDAQLLRSIYKQMKATEDLLVEIVEKTQEEFETEQLLDTIADAECLWDTQRMKAMCREKYGSDEDEGDGEERDVAKY